MPVSARRILVVEDDDLIRSGVAAALAGAGFAVESVGDGAAAEALFVAFRPDLVLLDVMLPGVDGLVLARRMRARADVAVIFMTARDATADRLLGFELGADDYVVKPFVAEELLARVRAVLRRRGDLPETLDLGSVLVDEAAQVAVAYGVPIPLTATEWRLLLHLARNRGRVLSKTQLLTQVWGYEEYDPNLVEVHLSALRRKLEEHGPRIVHTVRGVGYVLTPALARAAS